MSNFSLIILILLAIVAALNIKAMIGLSRNSSYSTKQKIFQFALIWLLPILGAVLVSSLAVDRNTERITTDIRDRSGNNDGHIRLENSSFETGGNGDAGGGD